MEKRKVRLHKKLRQDLSLRILSVVLAVIIWFVLSITLYPTVFMTVDDVPVTVQIEGTAAEEQGLSVIDFDENTAVDVSFNGTRYEIGSYTADDLHAFVDMSGITEAGTYNLNVKVTAGADSCEITKVTPSTVKVKLDYIKTVAVPIKVKDGLVSAAEGFSLGTPVVTPETITVKGPQKLVDEISYALYVINQKKTLTEAYTTSDGSIYLYSEDGSIIDKTPFELEYDPISVNYPVYFLKTLDFTFDYQGAPANFDTSILKYNLSEKSIDIMTSNDSILNQDTLHLGYINLSDINFDNPFTFNVNLDSDQKSASGIDKVTVTFDSTGFTSKEFIIPESNIKLINKPNNCDVTLATRAIGRVVIFGPEEVLESLSATDLIAEYDMQSMQLEYGSYTRNVKIYAPQINSVWCYGNYEIVFNVLEKQPTAPVIDNNSPTAAD